MKIFLSIVIGFHAFIHLLGFAKAFNLATAEQLSQPISKPKGLLWLAAAVFFSLSIILLLIDVDLWWIFSAAAICFSQSSIVLHWKEAKYGTLPNLLILSTAFISFNGCTSGYYDIYKTESEKRLKSTISTSIITEHDLAHLPLPIQKYLNFAGAVGKPKISNFRTLFKGEMRRSFEGEWFEISAQQHEFFGDHARLFYIESSVYGIPFDGLHRYIGDSATMQIMIASLFQIADAKGDTMTRSETVTLLNDMCLLAPSTLIDTSIQWQVIDSLTVKATFTNRDQTVSANLYFNHEGALTDFSSNDRYLSEDGETYYNYRWTTPVNEYKEFSGRMIPVSVEAVWHTPDGEFSYAKFRTTGIEYNCKEFK